MQSDNEGAREEKNPEKNNCGNYTAYTELR